MIKKTLPEGDYIIELLQEHSPSKIKINRWADTPLGHYLFQGVRNVLAIQLDLKQIQEICAERKHKDLVQSIISRLLNEQLFRMSSKYYHSFLFIEGGLWELLGYSNFSYNSLVSAITRAALKRSPDGAQGTISILQTRDANETTDYLVAIANNISTEHDLIRLPEIVTDKIHADPNERAKSILASYPGVGSVKAEDLLLACGSLEVIYQLLFEEHNSLLAIHGFGIKTLEKMQSVQRHKYVKKEDRKK